MKTARAVIGASYGDEGKGLVTDYLCSQGAGMVVRFNGGAQAGHTVVTPDGMRHVFHHLGSGTFLRVPTFLSQFFICNPLLLLQELDTFYRTFTPDGTDQYCPDPVVYAHPNCLVTTFADMIINQRMEDKLGDKRHGSCGVGINETVNRSKIPRLKITMADLWNNVNLEDKLAEICSKYAEFRCGTKIAKPEKMIEEFKRRCFRAANFLHPLGIAQCPDIVFEGAQGLLLDQSNRAAYPYVTRSHTGLRNVRLLCQQAGIEKLEPYYVSRTYLTRHGAGPLPGEEATMRFADDTNVDHNYQGSLRFAPLDANALLERCVKDAGSDSFRIVFTHCDQLAPPDMIAMHHSYGPTREDVR